MATSEFIRKIRRGANSSGKQKATCDQISKDIFIDAYCEEKHAGNMPSTCFNKEDRINVIQKFYLRTRKYYDKMQLKNHWDHLKNDWNMWKDLKGKETGLGWDHNKRTIIADDSWWEEKIQMNPNVGKFWDRGQERPNDMEFLFGDVSATGEFAYAPSSGLPPNFDDDAYYPNINDVTDDPVDDDDTLVVVEPTPDQIPNPET